MSRIPADKNVPSPKLAGVAGAVLLTGMTVQSGTGAAILIESGEFTIPVSGVHVFSADLSQLDESALALQSGANAFYTTYAWMQGDAAWRYSTHKQDIVGSGKTGYWPVDANTPEVIPVSDLNHIAAVGEAGPVRMYYKLFTVKSKFNRSAV
jgi:hypothetical protein